MDVTNNDVLLLKCFIGKKISIYILEKVLASGTLYLFSFCFLGMLWFVLFCFFLVLLGSSGGFWKQFQCLLFYNIKQGSFVTFKNNSFLVLL